MGADCFLKAFVFFFVDTDSKDVEEIKRKQTQSYDGPEQRVFQDVSPRFRFCPSKSGFSVSGESKFRAFSYILACGSMENSFDCMINSDFIFFHREEPPSPRPPFRSPVKSVRKIF